jgi:hypothetical protein
VAFIYARFGVAFFESTPCDPGRALRTRLTNNLGIWGQIAMGKMFVIYIYRVGIVTFIGLKSLHLPG